MSRIIAVDFDGTLYKDDSWPEIGPPNTELIELLKSRRALGDKLILWTCRDGKSLREAIDWCSSRGLVFDAINDNLQEMQEKYGNNPRKITADIYLDDKSCSPDSFKEVISCNQYSHSTQERAQAGALEILMETTLEERFLRTI